MAQYFFYPAEASVSAAEVVAYAESYRRLPLLSTQRSIADVVLTALPPHHDLDALLTFHAADEREAIERHITSVASQHRQTAEAIIPPLDPGRAAALKFIALTEPWQSYPAGAIGGTRQDGPVGVFAMFPGWTVDASGQLHFADPLPVSRPQRAGLMDAVVTEAAEPAAEVWELGHDGWGAAKEDPDPKSDAPIPTMTGVGDFVLELVQYVGNGIAMANPLAGLTLAFVSAQAQKVIDSLGAAPDVLGKVADMLAANNITLESDFSRAAIRTYEGWASTNFKPEWLNDVMTAPDANAPDIVEKLNKLNDFVAKMTADLDSRDAPVLVAVNLMVEDNPQASSDLFKPTTAMRKASGFFYAANYMLARGRQAFNAQYTMLGPKDSVVLGERLAAKSTEYLKDANALCLAVDKQVDARLALISAFQAPSGWCGVNDNYWTLSFAPSEAYNVYESEPCTSCGDYLQHAQEMAAKLKRIKGPDYRKHLCTWFWGSGDDSTFDDIVTAMRDSDAKVQALVAATKKEAGE